MNIMRRLISAIVVSFFFVPLVKPKTITVSLFKTDQNTWSRPFSYALETQRSKKSMKLPGKDQTLDIKKTLSSYKSIRKDGKVSFDDADDAHILHVCTKANGKGVCQTLNLADRHINNVIGIDNEGAPKSMTEQEVNQLIAGSKPPTLHQVTIKKTGTNKASWNIKAIKSDTGEDKNVVYGEINIKRDTSGPLAKKLKVPVGRPVFIVVNDGTPQKFPSIELDAVLYIDDHGIVTISGETSATLAEKDLKRQGHAARVATAKEEKALKARRTKRHELQRLETQEILVKGALKRAAAGTPNDLDWVLRNEKTFKQTLRTKLIESLSTDPANKDALERIRTLDELPFGDLVRNKQVFVALLQEFKLKELEKIQSKIKQLEDELAVVPIFEATHMNVPEADNED